MWGMLMASFALISGGLDGMVILPSTCHTPFHVSHTPFHVSGEAMGADEPPAAAPVVQAQPERLLVLRAGERLLLLMPLLLLLWRWL